MAALLGATKGGQDRPQDRDDVPFRNGNSATTANKNASSISAPPAAALSGKATSLPKTPTSTNDQSQPATPSPTAVSAASTQPTVATRKAPRLSRGPSALAPVRGANPEQTSPQPQQPQQQPAATAASVQSSSASVNTSSIDPLSQDPTVLAQMHRLPPLIYPSASLFRAPM
ncbi:hypothetical protein SPBR_09033 [Sporothrix brasiliensis 5110]|uniref:Uncharacterized protein n=1 Tax=Sporothrix brasiliensis 5110 TaxID=1398154 RepID=A0A0C2IXQ1_9PEZI|nr:uncharacterized protein SPBR_09033 [Sporothrix brasiliensis 5110]KIH89812.1 hypothetical protein SPBR_09033 [Sporothrix brasiliensis 5110]